ncbi:MAG: UDP-N-acetylmuramoyl-L-alanyl-D-glutamate--2,6-diaminopimelate ligase [Desulfomonile tiedjei]|uniref:UDP-N-acetylmuramoyl-L-alanyl-D-glutamate--2,6-diaminopimelate ligase n=1 Tax=Desulfomonile tiedjei TaxID=2358 RepID=A0A9D6V6W0_9BACT|nr:UDP-N-acetylmuramoyl-L-alanyl-D-glutamate--2,6-diaminopimelate ligase [Desulfomonile tiedjei]
MVTLKNILAALVNPVVFGDSSAEISGITHDSRKVRSGWLFVAMRGELTDGHDFIPHAINAGASAIMAEKAPRAEFGNVSWVMVPDTRIALGHAAAAINGSPTEKLVLVGITGTNGKTTLTFLMESIIKAAGGFPGVVGTVSHRWGNHEQAAANTTPEASDLQHLFGRMVDDGVTHAFVEVSSHGLHRGRLEGCEFDLGVFTNLTQDHLDYHGSFEEYYLAKRVLFRRLLPTSVKKDVAAVMNMDDPYGRRMASEIRGLPVIGYGISGACDVRPVSVKVDCEGVSGKFQTPRGELQINSRLAGSFNLMNILAAIAVSERLNIPTDAIRNGIRAVEVVPGRLERVQSDRAIAFVDYAHTPNALKNVLEALKAMRLTRIVTIMGCGGDRDKTKRPIMGAEAAAGSDFVIVTSDNPRSEDPVEIIRQVEVGVRDSGFVPLPEALNGKPLQSGHYKVIPDRGEAIAWAVRRLSPHDIILVAGKGHETYQEIKGIHYPFDDRDVLREELKKLAAQKNSDSVTREVSEK